MLTRKEILLFRLDGILVAETQDTCREFEGVTFVSEIEVDPDDVPSSVVEVVIDSGTWREMGEPGKITVVINPGDTMNTE